MQRWYKVYDFSKHGADPQRINSVRTIEIEGKRISLARTADGYFALDDKCPHAGARFGMGGYCEEDMMVCPVHRYRYNLQTGKGKQGDFINTYPTQLKADGVYVAIEKKWWQLW